MIVLDTHAWLWWVAEPDRLSEPAARAIEGADRIRLSTFSAWELAMLVVDGRISLDRDLRTWIGQALARERVESVPPSTEIAITAALLDRRSFPGDPVDRIIYATALASSSRLVTADRALRAFDPHRAVW